MIEEKEEGMEIMGIGRTDFSQMKRKNFLFLEEDLVKNFLIMRSCPAKSRKMTVWRRKWRISKTSLSIDFLVI
jgi:hypothetical protein